MLFFECVGEDRELDSFGRRGCGELGNGKNENSSEPIKIMSNVREVSLGDYHSAAITEKGDLYLWGSNLDGA